MKRLVVIAFPSLFIFMLMMPSVLSRRLPVENKTDSKARTPDTKNSTEEDHNQDAAPAPQLPPNIFLNPTQQCYTQFFANGKPPAGLDTINENMRYICQEVPEHPGTHFYATMFDEGRGIPLYSAYVLNANDVNFQEQPAAKWLQTKGIQHQGSDALYYQQPCQRGQLFPALTASGLPQNAQNALNAANGARSTYQYTNTVPHCGSSNIDQWRDWEGKIRLFAIECTAAPSNGQVYLITGVSFVAFTNTAPPTVTVPIDKFPKAVPNQPINPDAIEKPNSLWTAGMCVLPNGQNYSFAVIGNDVQDPALMLTENITLAELWDIIQDDVTTNGLKRSTGKEKLNLFPGIASSVDITLPETEYPPPPKPSAEKPTSPTGTSSARPQSPPPSSPEVTSSAKPQSPKVSSKSPSSPTGTSNSKPRSSKPRKTTGK